jgi:5-methylcytosine-specific restriction endonuclease McrA
MIIQNGFGEGHYHNPTIRKYLIEHNGNNCMICGQSGNNWNGKPITLIVDHIDGKSNNNKLDNLRIVCPNCDCQLPTYKAKNKGNSTRSYFIVQK